MADLDVKTEALILNRLTGRRTGTEDHGHGNAKGVPAAQDERRTSLLEDQWMTKVNGPKRSQINPPDPSLSANCALCKVFAPKVRVQVSDPIRDVEAHADRHIGVGRWKSDDSSDRSRCRTR
jgi:hypothetical protein